MQHVQLLLGSEVSRVTTNKNLTIISKSLFPFRGGCGTSQVLFFKNTQIRYLQHATSYLSYPRGTSLLVGKYQKRVAVNKPRSCKTWMYRKDDPTSPGFKNGSPFCALPATAYGRGSSLLCAFACRPIDQLVEIDGYLGTKMTNDEGTLHIMYVRVNAAYAVCVNRTRIGLLFSESMIFGDIGMS